MFLDEELEKIWTEGKIGERSKDILIACLNRVKEDRSFINVERVDNAYRLFASRHAEVKEMGFRNYMIHILGEDFKKRIGW